MNCVRRIAARGISARPTASRRSWRLRPVGQRRKSLLLQIDPNTVRNHFKRYRTEGLAGLNRVGEGVGGSPSLLTEEQLIRLVPVDNSLIFINFMNRLRAKRTDSLTNRFFLLSIRPV